MTGGVCWNTDNDGLAPSKSTEQSWTQVDRLTIHSQESLWLELQMTWEDISAFFSGNIITLFHRDTLYAFRCLFSMLIHVKQGPWGNQQSA